LYMFCGVTAADSASWPPKAGPQLRSSVRISKRNGAAPTDLSVGAIYD